MEGMKHVVLLVLVLSIASCELVSSTEARRYHRLPLGPDQRGPESLAFDCNGEGPYVGISDGRIIKWEGRQGWIDFAVTSPNRSDTCNGLFNSPMELQCGRPLGLRFNHTSCELYVVDAGLGLMKVGRNGGIATPLATSAEGVPFKLLNGLDVDSENGVIYFADSSSRFPRWESLKAVLSGDKSGRFMKYDLKTQKVTVLLRGLTFPNGVALSKSKDFVLVTETTTARVLKFWLTGPKAGTSELFLQLKGNPDAINRDAKGDFWIAESMAKSIKVDEYGRVLDIVDVSFGSMRFPSDITEFRKRLWIGFVDQPYILFSSYL